MRKEKFDIYMKNKLLIIGGSSDEASLVLRAKELGVYVIIVNEEINCNITPELNLSDEKWIVSLNDIDRLQELCIVNSVNGIIAGYTEDRIKIMMELCERLNLPTYLTAEQFENTRNKKKFKKLCQRYGLKTVKDYNTPESVDEFPIIVKPVDRFGSVGISIAHNKEELWDSVMLATEKSLSKEIIIEKCITNRTKVDLYFAVEKGVVSLISSCDTISEMSDTKKEVIQLAWMYPARSYELIKKKTEPLVVDMIKEMGIYVGCISFSGFVDEMQGEIEFFECAFRLEGGHQDNYVKKIHGFNYLDIFINNALGIKKNVLIVHDEIEPLKCVTVNVYICNGTLLSCKNIDKISQMENSCMSIFDIYEGMKVDSHSGYVKGGIFSFCNSSANEIEDNISKVYKMVEIIDTQKKTMIKYVLRKHIVSDWWS